MFLARVLKALRSGPPKAPPPRVAGLFAPPYPAAGWWHDDPVEHLRNYRSWVYAAVNAIGQEVARHRPYLYRNTGQAEHEQVPLPHTHPLCRLLDNPNPWLTPWELWYLTIVYLELTGNAFWYVAPQSVGDTRLGTPGEIWIIPTPWVRIVPDRTEYVKAYPDTKTSSPTGSAIDMISADGPCFAIQQVGDISDDTTLAGRIEQSESGSSGWTAIDGAEFAEVATDNHVQVIQFVRTARYVRYAATLDGDTPSVKLAVVIGEQKTM